MENNAVTKEVFKIAQQWNEIKKHTPDEVCLFCWKSSRLELQFVDAFVKYQLSEGSSGKDVFLLFIQEFTSPFTYGQSIIEDFATILQAWYDGLTPAQKEKKEPFKVIGKEYLKKETIDARFFIENINSLHQYYELDPKDKLVLVFNPATIKQYEDFQDWLILLAEANTSAAIKFMIYDGVEHPMYTRVLKKVGGTNAMVVTPNVDALQAVTGSMKEAFKDPEDPYLHFQQYLVKAGGLFASNPQKALGYTEKALTLATQHQFLDGITTVYLMQTQLYSIQNKKREALKTVKKGIQRADHNPAMLLQLKMLQGSLYFQLKETEDAYTVYKEAAALAKDKDIYISIEAHRLYAYFADKLSLTPEAQEAYKIAFDQAISLSSEEIKGTSLNLIALEMMDFAEVYGYTAISLQKEVARLLEDDHWYEKTTNYRKSKALVPKG